MSPLTEVLVECVRMAGGAKQVGAALWPERTTDSAARQLLDCMNADRPAKLSPEQLLQVFRMARARGCHAGINFFAAELGYSLPAPIEPRDEYADLQRQFIAQVDALAKMAERINQHSGAAMPLLKAA